VLVPRPLRRASRGSWRARTSAWLADDTGAATAEYAIVIMAAVSFAGLLVVIMRSGAVQATLTDLIQKALTVG
jgi:Flp pilus assembly pilin Flp